MTLTIEDQLGLREMRSINNEFLQNDRGSSESVRFYMREIAENDQVLLHFLWGRKYRSKYAWETLKRNAEVRLDECPELFPSIIPSKVVAHVKDKNIFGVLKARDNYGRYVVIFNAGAWDPDLCSLEDMVVVFIRLMETLLKDENFAKQGFTYIQQSLGVELKHARQYSLNSIRKLIKVFWQSFPIQLKALHYVNVPNFIRYTFALGRPFFPRKLKERLVISSVESGYQEIHRLIPKNELPIILGGPLSFEEAFLETLSLL